MPNGDLYAILCFGLVLRTIGRYYTGQAIQDPARLGSESSQINPLDLLCQVKSTNEVAMDSHGCQKHLDSDNLGFRERILIDCHGTYHL